MVNVSDSGAGSPPSRLRKPLPDSAGEDLFSATSANGAPSSGASNTPFTFDPANAARAFSAGLQANGLDPNQPNTTAAGTFIRRGGDLQRLFPLLAAINPGQYGNANSPADSQKFFQGLPGNFEGLIHGVNPGDLLGSLFSNQDPTSPLGQSQIQLGNNPQELANVLGAILSLNASPYASNFMGRYLESLVSNTNSNADLLNKHGGNLLGAVQEALRGIKTFQ